MDPGESIPVWRCNVWVDALPSDFPIPCVFVLAWLTGKVGLSHQSTVLFLTEVLVSMIDNRNITSHLPDKLLTKILLYLLSTRNGHPTLNTMSTCKRWQSLIVANALFWTNIYVSAGGRFNDEQVWELFLQRSKDAQLSLRIDEMGLTKSDKENICSKFAPHFPRVRALKLYSPSPTWLQPAINYCTSLRHFKVAVTTRTKPDGFGNFLPPETRLTMLRVDCRFPIILTLLDTLYLGEIEEITVRQCPIAFPEILPFLKSCIRLQSLIFANLNLGTKPTKIPQIALPLLEVLEIGGSPQILEACFSRLPSLLHLTIDATLYPPTLPKREWLGLPELRTLTLLGVDMAQVKPLFSSSPHLTAIHLRGRRCSDLVDRLASDAQACSGSLRLARMWEDIEVSSKVQRKNDVIIASVFGLLKLHPMVEVKLKADVAVKPRNPFHKGVISWDEKMLSTAFKDNGKVEIVTRGFGPRSLQSMYELGDLL